MRNRRELLRPAIIAAYRTSDMTQAQLSKAVFGSAAMQGRISRYLNGKMDLKGRTIDRLIHSLNVAIKPAAEQAKP